MKQPIQYTTGTHKGRSSLASSARLVNLFAEALPPDANTPVVLYGTPGTEEFVELPTHPVRGAIRFDEELYAVTPSNFYHIAEDGTVTDLGSVTIIGPVSMAISDTYVVFVDGNKGYHYSASSGLVEFSGAGWYPADTVTYQDGYFIFNRSDTRQFFLTELNAITFDASMYASAEGWPDNLLAVFSDHLELWLFGEHSVEVWYNSGADATMPFERIQGAFIERGIAAPHSVAKVDNSIFWLSEDGMVYRAAGYQPQRISTHAVEYDIQQGTFDDAISYAYTHEGHTFYVLTLPSQARTWCFDSATSEWHERSHIRWGRHHSNCYAWCYDQHFVGDYQSGKIYRLKMDAYDDDGDEIQRIAVSPILHANRNWAIAWNFEVYMETGLLWGFSEAGVLTFGSDTLTFGSELLTFGSDGARFPQAMLQWSNDGGKTWSNERWASLGATGEYLTRVQWPRLGRFRQRQFKVIISDPVPVVILGAYVEIENARH